MKIEDHPFSIMSTCPGAECDKQMGNSEQSPMPLRSYCHRHSMIIIEGTRNRLAIAGDYKGSCSSQHLLNRDEWK